MSTAKALMLAALSLGVGTAMAQSEIPSAAKATYSSGRRMTVPQTINSGSGPILFYTIGR
jgi:hypothetical protein